MNDILPPLPEPPLDLSPYENRTDTETVILELVVLAATQTSPLRVEKIKALAKTLDCPVATFNKCVKEERYRLQRIADAERTRRAEEEGAKAVAIGGDSELFFDGTNYYRKERDGCYGSLVRADAIMHMKRAGFNHASENGELTPAERALGDVQIANRVSYAGQLCGRKAGLHEANGTRVLCVDSPKFIEGEPGEHPTINNMLSGLLGENKDPHFAEQRALVVQWLRLARVAMRTTDRHLPGQVLMIVGPTDCGKSMLQKYVFTPAMGGRLAKPNQWLTGATPFNDDIWGAEHLMIDDLTDMRDAHVRDAVRDVLKEMVAATDYPLHPKGRRGRTFRPIWRISLTANDDPVSVGNIPGLNGGFADKMILLRAYTPPTPLWDDKDPEGRSNFEDAIRREMPSFLHEVDNMPCPADLYKPRFGIREWHHPQIADLVESSDPIQFFEDALHTYIQGLSTINGAPVKGKIRLTATQIWQNFEEHGPNLRVSGICRSVKQLSRDIAQLMTKPRWQGKITKVKSNLSYFEFTPIETPDKK